MSKELEELRVLKQVCLVAEILEDIKPFAKLETNYNNGCQFFYLKIGNILIEISQTQYDLLEGVLL